MRVLLLLASLLFPNVIFADDGDRSRFYIGGSVGASLTIALLQCSDLPACIHPCAAGRCFQEYKYKKLFSPNARVFAGYVLNEYIQLEAAGIIHGEFKLAPDGAWTGARLPGWGWGMWAEDYLRTRVYSASAAVRVGRTFDKAFLFVKAGAHWWRSEIAGIYTDHPTHHENPRSGVNALFGAGVEFKKSDAWSVRLEYERYKFDYVDINSFSVGLRYNIPK